MHNSPFRGTLARVQAANGILLSENLYDADTRLPSHTHEASFFSLTIAGAYVETHGRRQVDYEVGSVSFHPPHEEHCVAMAAATRCLNVEVPNAALARLREVMRDEPRLIRATSGPLVWLATRLYDEFRVWTPSSTLTAEGLVLEMLGAVAKVEEGEQRMPRWIETVEEILRAEYARSLTVTELAARVGVHPVHLSRTWRRFRRCSIGHAVHQVRIDEACRRIAAGPVSLAELALEVGFADQTHFSRVFKQVTGMTPGTYRATRGL